MLSEGVRAGVAPLLPLPLQAEGCGKPRGRAGCGEAGRSGAEAASRQKDKAAWPVRARAKVRQDVPRPATQRTRARARSAVWTGEQADIQKGGAGRGATAKHRNSAPASLRRGTRARRRKEACGAPRTLHTLRYACLLRLQHGRLAIPYLDQQRGRGQRGKVQVRRRNVLANIRLFANTVV